MVERLSHLRNRHRTAHLRGDDMIRLERSGSVPTYMLGDFVEGCRTRVKQFFDRPEASRRQERPEFALFPKPIYERLMLDLLELSHRKCAYCETPIEFPGNASLDRYRPKAGALGLDGNYSTEHYWWLAYAWDNINPTCSKCNKFKGGKFPVEGPRAGEGPERGAMIREKRLLLDPFVDDPTEHLDFIDNGSVVPRSSAGDVTIATLELNRAELVRQRHSQARATRNLLAQAKLSETRADYLETWIRSGFIDGEVSRVSDASLREIFRRASSEHPWAAVARALLTRWADDPTRATPPAPPRPAGEQVDPKVVAAQAIISSVASISSAFMPETFGKNKQERQLSRKAQQLRSRVVTRVALRNFRGVKDLDLKIDYARGDGAPWTVLLGENAAGKSSILQAIALTLIDTDADAGNATSPTQVIKKGTSEGWVRVWLDESIEPRQLLFGKRMRRFRRTGPSFSNVLLGYGATRLLPRTYGKRSKSRVRLDNMFDPFSPLLDANRWLGELDRRSFDYVARALKDVLDLPRSSTLKRVRRQKTRGVTLKLYGDELSLDELSDGYQSALGLTCDIISGLHASSKGALEAAEGLVVLDELGAHLHPRWRMRIVESLRKAFRRVQFIVSTHDPLCLRGLENDEAIVLRRTSRRRIFVVPNTPPLKGMRVDQILTSEYFGLDSTMDPTVERQYRELYRLLALREPTPKQVARIAAIREELAPFEIPGATRRERRLLQIIDQELAETDEEPDATKREAIKGQTAMLVNDLNLRLAAGAPA
jgi:hypothetical protein